MKGIILAGGRGTRLSPLTDVVNKFLHPVYDKLMIEYSVDSLVSAGVTDIAIILGQKSAGETMNYLKSGKKYGANFTYFYQDEPKGVPHALSYAREWAGKNKIIVLCADNIMYDDLSKVIKTYEDKYFKALVSIKHFDRGNESLKKYAVLQEKEDDSGLEFVEKPQEPTGQNAFCGVQIYDDSVWKVIDSLWPSERDEYEITDVINHYLNIRRCGFYVLREQWFDCGNKDDLLKAQMYAGLNR